MKNNVLKMIKYLYYFSLILLLILYFFPGSLVGYILYGDFGRQPDFIPNPIGSSINHTLAFFYLSILSLIRHMKEKSFSQTKFFLISLSILLELSHYFIPNRSFEYQDLLGNLFGVTISIVIIKLILFFKERNAKIEKLK